MRKDLIGETEWSRAYRMGSRTFSSESKFEEGMDVSLEFVRDHWSGWTLTEQLEFVNAFIWKRLLTDEDQLIIRFLLESDSQPVLETVAYLLPRYADREQAVSFLLRQVASKTPGASNYYRALEMIGDPRAIPALRLRYAHYREALSPFERLSLHSELADYQACCRALWKLEGSVEYQAALRELLHHPDLAIRRRSQFFLLDQVVDRLSIRCDFQEEWANPQNPLSKSRAYSDEEGNTYIVYNYHLAKAQGPIAVYRLRIARRWE